MFYLFVFISLFLSCVYPCKSVAKFFLLCLFVAKKPYSAAMTTPRHSPKPILLKPSRSQKPRIIISSPSSKKRRVSPFGSSNGCLPPPANRKRYGLFPAEATSTCTPMRARNMRIAYWIFLGSICANGIKLNARSSDMCPGADRCGAVRCAYWRPTHDSAHDYLYRVYSITKWNA